MTRVVVTGAAGLLGHAVAAEFKKSGAAVLEIDRVAAPRIEFSDLSDIDILARQFAGVDAIIHCAAIAHLGAASEERIFVNNVSSTMNVLLAAEAAQVPRIVYASSQSALGLAYSPVMRSPDRVPVDETHPCRPVEAYGLSKLVGEQVCEMLVRRAAFRVAVLRFPVIWSPGNFQSHVSKRLGNPEQGAKSQWAYIDVRDAASACRLAANGWFGHNFEIFNIASDRPFEFEATIPDLIAVYGRSLDIDRGYRPGSAIFSSAKARGAIGFSPRYRWSRSGISGG